MTFNMMDTEKPVTFQGSAFRGVAFSHCIPVLVMMAAVLIFQHNVPGFLQDASSHGMAIARNLSAENGFLMHSGAYVDVSGKLAFGSYNRFPIFPFLILRLSMLPAGNDLKWQFYFARQAMNIFFALAMYYTYLIIYMFTGNQWRSTFACAMVFSAYCFNLYNDMAFNDIPALFGYVFLIYAICMNGRSPLRPFTAYASILALCMGWQAYAVMVSWLVFDTILFLDEFRSQRSGAAIQETGARMSLREAFRLFLSRPAFRCFLLGLAVGTTMLCGNFFNEWIHSNCNVKDLSTSRSVVARFGFDRTFNRQLRNKLKWRYFFYEQLYQIMLTSTPVLLVEGTNVFDIFKNSFEAGGVRSRSMKYYRMIPGKAAEIFSEPDRSCAPSRAWNLFVSLTTIMNLAAVIFVSLLLYRNIKDAHALTCMFILLASGLFWSIPLKHFVTFHEYQSVFYIGIPILVYTAISIRVESRSALLTIAFASMALFMLTSYIYNSEKASLARNSAILTGEFQKIADILPPSARVYFDGDKSSAGIRPLGVYADYAPYGVDFYLAGRIFVPIEIADYIVSRNEKFNDKKITDNKLYNLFAAR
jgi:hypothetical protein